MIRKARKMGTAELDFSADLHCIECGAAYSLSSVRYTCDKCGGLLEVRHDMNALATRSAGQWRELFTNRSGAGRHPFASGVWSRKEWVHPALPVDSVVSLGEGNSPLLPLPRLAAVLGLGELYLKQCGVSHTGSFKDLGMTVLVSHVVQLIREGFPIRAVACASTGDTSAALAAYAAAAGVPTIVFLPEGKITKAQLIQPLACGAHVLALQTDFDGCMEIVKEVTQDNSIYLANSMNPLRLEGQKTISVEIVQQLGWEVPDWIVIPGGNLGNVSALGSGLQMLRTLGLIDRVPRICLAQAESANPMYRSYQNNFRKLETITAQATQASAIRIGNPVSYPRAVRALREFDGVVEQASEQELSEAAARVDTHGMFNCPHTGVALAAMFKLVQRGEIKSGQRVVVISTAHGLKFARFKEGYHQGTLEAVHSGDSAYRNDVTPLAADPGLVKEYIAGRLPAAVEI